jgi:hypothetical protein
MCEIDLEPCDVFAETYHVARKIHRCSCCGGSIQPGARYLRTFGIFEGDMFVERGCLACGKEIARFSRAHEGIRFTPGTLDFVLEECIENEPESAKPWRAMQARIRARGTAPR